MQLSSSTVGSLSADVEVPRYDRSLISVGIVHFGVGGFHRSHEAMFVDRLLNQGEAFEWGICGIGVLPHDKRIIDIMTDQDGLYTLELKNADGSRDLRVIGSIVELLLAPDNPEAVIERLVDPAVRIVSLTITEGGYNFDQVTGGFDTNNPAVLRDASLTAPPVTVFGLVVEALSRRRDRGIQPFTVMSCDNIQNNGEVARRSFAGFARLRSAELGDWIELNVAFPNSMVDRITPVTTDDDRAEVASHLGASDEWPVVAEPFAQWVLEDHFPQGRPAWEKVGVQVVEDVMPYELMKLRLLNATHQGLCYFGYLAGYRYVHEAAADPAIAHFLLEYMDKEATPTLLPVPGVDLYGYKRNLIERYRNREVRDTLARLCAESSDRIPKWLVPVIREQLAVGGVVSRSAAIVASWARYAEGIDERGESIEIVDRLRDQLVMLAQSQKRDPLAFLRNPSLFGDLVNDARFTNPYLAALDSLHQRGAMATLESYTRSE